MYVRTYICMCVLLAPGRLDGFYSYSAFKSLSIIGRCPVNMNILPKKNRDLWNSPQRIESLFSQNRLERFWLNFSDLWRPHFSKKPSTIDIIRKIAVCSLVVKMFIQENHVQYHCTNFFITIITTYLVVVEYQRPKNPRNSAAPLLHSRLRRYVYKPLKGAATESVSSYSMLLSAPSMQQLTSSAMSVVNQYTTW
jgi:hypothetical protein